MERVAYIDLDSEILDGHIVGLDACISCGFSELGTWIACRRFTAMKRVADVNLNSGNFKVMIALSLNAFTGGSFDIRSRQRCKWTTISKKIWHTHEG
ncbi:uncharacterized protein FFB20_07793 [Fusarium fujikuroi]|uniref:Uncharacterized protein n=1 Tax=Fusarium fujikuroi TaxID=5127 RepID=A0A9Q9RIX2_FUSFU|nr:uncharacterized protein FFB20_07793 [Fusarium fujikuroi]VTT65593.1 unnamed protein product [Fusarium fujikuroi]VTT70338.1 unnamed protein product [Fusarium fujikuroi]VZH88197.1 unnamed protein product [Fusarium fujikuroi]